MIAYGRRFVSLVAPPPRTIGSTGSTQGEIAVTTPARKPIPRRSTTTPTGRKRYPEAC
jgi:hypothetical protein